MKLDDIEKLIAAATPAPWEYIERDGGAINCVDVWRSGRVTVERTQSDPVDRANAAFIAASRTLMPKLLKVVRAAQNIGFVVLRLYAEGGNDSFESSASVSIAKMNNILTALTEREQP